MFGSLSGSIANDYLTENGCTGLPCVCTGLV